MKTVTLNHAEVLKLKLRKDEITTVTIDETRSPVSIGNSVWAAFAGHPRETRVALSRAAIAALGVSAKLPASS